MQEPVNVAICHSGRKKYNKQGLNEKKNCKKMGMQGNLGRED